MVRIDLRSLKLEGFVYPSAVVYATRREGAQIRLGCGSHLLGELLLDTSTAEIVIGERTYISAGTRIWARSSVRIGNYTIISHGVDIHDSNSHPLDWGIRRLDCARLYHRSAPELRYDDFIAGGSIVIGDDVWIGFKASILKGVEIGRGAIIAAGAVVTKSVDPFTVVAGNPARVIRKLDERSVESRLNGTDFDWNGAISAIEAEGEGPPPEARSSEVATADVEADLQRSSECVRQQQTYIQELEQVCAERQIGMQTLDRECNRLREKLNEASARSWRRFVERLLRRA